MFGTMAKLLAVVGGLLADSYPVLVACSMVCSYLLLGMYVLPHACSTSFAYYRACRYVATTLPFFNRYMNQFRVSASFLVAFLSCGSVILSTAKPSSPGTFSAIWIGLSLFVIAAASLLPRLRMKMLRDKLMAMRPRMLEELDEKHKCVRTTDMNRDVVLFVLLLATIQQCSHPLENPPWLPTLRRERHHAPQTPGVARGHQGNGGPCSERPLPAGAIAARNDR